jgi:two-component system LytT family response regulator
LEHARRFVIPVLNSARGHDESTVIHDLRRGKGMSGDNSPIIAPFRTVLLDDDPFDREHFRHLLRRHPSIQLIGEADNFPEALRLIEEHEADVLFLESEIGGKSLLDSCPLIPLSVRLIFLTKHQTAAVRAFEFEALDFLVKPLTSHRFSETVRRLLRIEWKRSSQEPPAPPSATVLIPFERGRRGVSLEEIGLIQAFGNYTRVSMENDRSEIVLRSLAKWQKLLPMPPFLRVHRNALVHGKKVRHLEETASGVVLHLAGLKDPVPVSRRCLPEVRQALFSAAN